MGKVNFKHVWLVAKREYLERVRTKAFIIMTLITPAMMFGFAVVPSLLSMRKTGGKRHIVVVSTKPELGEAVKLQIMLPPTKEEEDIQIKKRDGPVPDVKYTVDLSTDTSDAAQSALQRKIDSKEIDGFLWLSDEALEKAEYTYTAASTNDFVELGKLQTSINRAVMRFRLGTRGITGDDFEKISKRMNLEPVTWIDGKAIKGNFLVKLLSSILLVVTLYVTLLMYGMNVMRAVLEEKTSRIMEVLMSALTPAELLGGKIIGVGAVGITQILIWTGMGAIISAPGMFTAASLLKDVNLSASTGIYFVVFYLLGYVLYSSMFAAVGAMVNSEQEAQQLQFFVMLPLIISTIMMMLVIRTPNDPLVVGMSMFPFCAPILMYLRIIVQQPPFWQIAVCIGILLMTIWFMMYLCSRIYRVGILMYGKKPTLPEIIKWIRYA